MLDRGHGRVLGCFSCLTVYCVLRTAYMCFGVKGSHTRGYAYPTYDTCRHSGSDMGIHALQTSVVHKINSFLGWEGYMSHAVDVWRFDLLEGRIGHVSEELHLR